MKTGILALQNEAVFLRNTNFDYSYQDIKDFLEFGLGSPLNTTEWDEVLYALDQDVFGRQEHNSCRYDAYDCEGEI